ncbi:alpha/beta hydrolase [Actinotignum urinale]|uniref:Alpha/beta hydrolase n=1 Tax=Actinotignum urinale TaxID=190146 RepID=A0AAW9HNG5_9ACTO|nr:alpha/beta hydrolase [Actinotignum urinale]MDY5155191.1 alpha/beta hydrolase [Actinotignum urinale]
MSTNWTNDPLGEDYQQKTLELVPDREGRVVTTLIRHCPRETAVTSSHPATTSPSSVTPPLPSFALLAIHGWDDYFYQTPLSEAITASGGAFYAVDLRKYGRSLLPGQSYGYTKSMKIYNEDITVAFRALKDDLHERYGSVADSLPIFLYGHSTGGLIAALYADGARKEKWPVPLAGLILNSPWLDLQGGLATRFFATQLAELGNLIAPKAVLPVPPLENYAHTLRAWTPDGGPVPGTPAGTTDPFWVGGWCPDWDMRPEHAPIRAGWLRAVLRGHRAIKRHTRIYIPVLMLTSAESRLSVGWHEELRGVDTVLDVKQMWKRGERIAKNIEIRKIKNAIHDVTLSRAPVREQALNIITDFCLRHLRR